jgi:hypothetical protein
MAPLDRRFEYVYLHQASLLGAARLGQILQSGRPPVHGQANLSRDKEAVS